MCKISVSLLVFIRSCIFTYSVWQLKCCMLNMAQWYTTMSHTLATISSNIIILAPLTNTISALILPQHCEDGRISTVKAVREFICMSVYIYVCIEANCMKSLTLLEGSGRPACAGWLGPGMLIGRWACNLGSCEIFCCSLGSWDARALLDCVETDSLLILPEFCPWAFSFKRDERLPGSSVSLFSYIRMTGEHFKIATLSKVTEAE